MTYNEAISFLGVTAVADKQAIKAAYRRLAAKLHPDAGGTDDQFRRLQQAYETALAGQNYTYEDIPYYTYCYTDVKQAAVKTYPYWQGVGVFIATIMVLLYLSISPAIMQQLMSCHLDAAAALGKITTILHNTGSTNYPGL